MPTTISEIHSAIRGAIRMHVEDQRGKLAFPCVTVRQPTILVLENDLQDISQEWKWILWRCHLLTEHAGMCLWDNRGECF